MADKTQNKDANPTLESKLDTYVAYYEQDRQKKSVVHHQADHERVSVRFVGYLTQMISQED